MIFKVSYQYIARSGKLSGSIRSGTVGVEAKDAKEAAAKAAELVKNYGHENARMLPPVQW